jgi:uncharacterized protein YjbJ (UPF0337 family)
LLEAKEKNHELGSNRRQVEGTRGFSQGEWGKLTDNEWTELKGKRDRLSGVIQQKYGIAKEEAEKQIKEFEAACKC